MFITIICNILYYFGLIVAGLAVFAIAVRAMNIVDKMVNDKRKMAKQLYN